VDHWTLTGSDLHDRNGIFGYVFTLAGGMLVFGARVSGDGVSDVGVSALHEAHECAKGTLEMLDVDLVRLSPPEVDVKHFQRALGALMYLMLGTRPDIACTVVALGRMVYARPYCSVARKTFCATNCYHCSLDDFRNDARQTLGRPKLTKYCPALRELYTVLQ